MPRNNVQQARDYAEIVAQKVMVKIFGPAPVDWTQERKEIHQFVTDALIYAWLAGASGVQ